MPNYNPEQKKIIQKIIVDKIEKTKNYLTDSMNPLFKSKKEELDNQVKSDKKLQLMLKNNKIIKEKEIKQLDQINDYVRSKYKTNTRNSYYDGSNNVLGVNTQDATYSMLGTKKPKLEELKNILLLETAGDIADVESILKDLDKRIADALK